MKKEKADLERLLNSLIEKGFRPFGRYDKLMGSGRFGSRQFVKFGIFPEEEFTLRELVSINSGLWQFVCDREHRFIDKKNYEGVRSDKRLKNPYVDYDGVNTEYEWITSLDYQYRLIESSLIDESELEDFLLSNIKAEGEA